MADKPPARLKLMCRVHVPLASVCVWCGAGLLATEWAAPEEEERGRLLLLGPNQEAGGGGGEAAYSGGKGVGGTKDFSRKSV